MLVVLGNRARTNERIVRKSDVRQRILVHVLNARGIIIIDNEEDADFRPWCCLRDSRISNLPARSTLGTARGTGEDGRADRRLPRAAGINAICSKGG